MKSISISTELKSIQNSIRLFIGLALFLCYLIPKESFSQSFPPSANPAYWEFNTGIGSTASPTLAPGSNDGHWKATTSSSGGGALAKVINSSTGGFPCYWSQSTSTSAWISLAAGFGCSADIADYSCLTAGPDVFYTYTFTLPASPSTPVFAIDWQLFASGWVQDIEVNGTVAWNSYITVPNPPLNVNMAVAFKWCKFQPGLNTILVHVKNRAPTTGGCNRTGLKVHSWGFVANYTTYINNFTYTNTISGSTLVCPNKPFTFSVPNGTAGNVPSGNSTVYKWTVPNSWPTTVGYSGNNVYSGPSSGVNSGLISVMGGAITGAGTQTNFACHSTAVFSVTVPPPPNIITTSSLICSGKCATLTASGASTYTWYASTSIPFSNSYSVVICPTQNTTYNLWATTNPGNCKITKSLYVPVAQPPILIINSSPTVICQGLGVSLWASGNAPTYTWMPVSTSNSTSASIIVYPTANTVYTLTGTSAAGCKTVKTKSVIVNPTPTLNVSASPSVICSGNSSNLSVSGALNYTWSPTGQNVPNIIVSPTVTTTYTVTGAFPATGCSKSKTIQVLVNPSPTVVVTPPSFCPGISNTLTASGGITYTWTLYGNPSNTVIPNQNPIFLTPLTNSLHVQVCSSGSNGCIKCTTLALLPGTPIPLTVSDLTLCTSASLCTSISVTSSLTTFTNTWTLPGSPTGSIAVVCPTVSTIYSVNAYPTGTIGCPASATLAITVQTNCCGASTLGLTQLTGLSGTFANNSYLLDASFTLTNNTTFQNAEVWITPGVQITVPNGLKLNLDHAHLFACSNVMWKGIKILDGGGIATPSSAVSPSNSMIEDAEIAIELDNIITQPIGLYHPIMIEGIIFNKNRIGIRISNAVSTVTAFGLGINGCVFSSRDMPFTTYLAPPMSWPSSGLTGVGLKVALNPTTGLVPPYIPVSMPQANLKLPYNNQPGHIGIQIENIGDPNDVTIGANTVDFAIFPTSSISGDFNLFDGLGTGIEVLEAGLLTNKAVFQNMQVYSMLVGTTTVLYGGNGIDHTITSLRNAHCWLNTVSTSAPFGARFWDCVKGINAENVYSMYVDHSVFRSTQSVVNWLTPNTVGAYGIHSNTNRFYHYAYDNEFNNVRYGFSLNTPLTTSSYDMGNGPVQGIYADMLYLEKNYFGPEVLSSTPYSLGSPNTSEYLDEAIQVLTPNTVGWASSSPATTTLNASIIHNRIDRAYRGVHIESMEDFPLAVEGNSIYIEDDFTYGSPGNPAFGYGIGLMNSTDNKSILTNTISGISSIPISSIAAVFCKLNLGTNSPNVHCNFTSNSYYGFQFDDYNGDAIWEANHMCNEWAGLALTNSAVIGQQGTPTLGSDNAWESGALYPGCQPWGIGSPNGALHETYIENSDALNSPLFMVNTSWSIPNNSFGSNNGLDYNQAGALNMPPGIIANPANVDCAQDNTSTVPSWRTQPSGNNASIKSGEYFSAEAIQVFPNPTNGQLNILYEDPNSSCSIRILDLKGQVMHSDVIKGGVEYACNISSLPATVYILELRKESETIRKKLIKTN